MKMLVTGGARSGKSSFALKTAESMKLKKHFIATAEALDEEMEARIEKHRHERRPDWFTIEEPVDIGGRVKELDSVQNLLLIDCLGLWTSNLLMKCSANEFENRSAELADAIKGSACSIVIVSNEVGLGIVPADPFTRQYRDMLGKLNQSVASVCDSAVLLVCGIPVWLKQAPSIPQTEI